MTEAAVARLAERVPVLAVKEDTAPGIEAGRDQRVVITVEIAPAERRAVQQIDLGEAELLEKLLFPDLALPDMAAEGTGRGAERQLGRAFRADLVGDRTRFGVLVLETGLHLDRAVPLRRAGEVEDDAVGLDDAGKPLGIDLAQTAADRLDEGALVQHRPEDDDAADRLAVEALGQHHAVGEHLRLTGIEAGDAIGALVRRHLAGDG